MEANPYHPIFTAQTIPHLLKPQLEPSKAELQWVKQSLLCKHKAASGVQQLLLTNKQEQISNSSMSAKNMLESERKKYSDYLRKNYADKISPQLMSLHALRNRVKEVEQKERENRKEEEKEDLHKPSRKRVQPKEPAPGRKQKKTEAEKGGPGGKKEPKKSQKDKKKGEKVQIAQRQEAGSPELREMQEQIESLSVDLGNDMYQGSDDLEMNDQE